MSSILDLASHRRERANRCGFRQMLERISETDPELAQSLQAWAEVAPGGTFDGTPTLSPADVRGRLDAAGLEPVTETVIRNHRTSMTGGGANACTCRRDDVRRLLGMPADDDVDQAA